MCLPTSNTGPHRLLPGSLLASLPHFTLVVQQIQCKAGCRDRTTCPRLPCEFGSPALYLWQPKDVTSTPGHVPFPWELCHAWGAQQALGFSSILLIGGQERGSERLLWRKEKETADLWSSIGADNGEAGKIHHFNVLGAQRHDTKSWGDAPNINCNTRGCSKDSGYLSTKSSACGCAYLDMSKRPLNAHSIVVFVWFFSPSSFTSALLLKRQWRFFQFPATHLWREPVLSALQQTSPQCISVERNTTVQWKFSTWPKTKELAKASLQNN